MSEVNSKEAAEYSQQLYDFLLCRITEMVEAKGEAFTVAACVNALSFALGDAIWMCPTAETRLKMFTLALNNIRDVMKDNDAAMATQEVINAAKEKS